MFRLKMLFLVLFFVGLMGSVQVFAQDSEPAPQQTEMDQFLKETTATAAAKAEANSQIATNTADIAEIHAMTGTQDFILKLVAIVMPLLIAMMTGIMLYIQIKQKQVSEVRQVEQREDLILVARSVNGMKTELIAKSELAAFLEGVQIEAHGQMSANAAIRLAELQESVKYATERANDVAAKSVEALRAKQAGKTVATQIVCLAHGQTKIIEGVEFGEEPHNPNAIPVASGEAKTVVGTEA